VEVLRYAAFSRDPAGGNPAGVVLDARGESDESMQQVAADVGFAETAFVLPRGDDSGSRGGGVRYFSPMAEVPFCGHATIATAVAHAQRFGPGRLQLDTRAGLVEVFSTAGDDGTLTATLTSVPPRVAPLPAGLLAALLSALDWPAEDLDPRLPPRLAFAGAWHPIIAAAGRERLARLDYDVGALGALMAEQGWTTIDLVWQRSEHEFDARNPFPPGGLFEDPATGAAAAAFGGYLRELGLIRTPATVTVHQGADLGRPGLITVDVPADPEAGIHVTGTAVSLD
jgi:PhzF family phenazine biosynthesis protein